MCAGHNILRSPQLASTWFYTRCCGRRWRDRDDGRVAPDLNSPLESWPGVSPAQGPNLGQDVLAMSERGINKRSKQTSPLKGLLIKSVKCIQTYSVFGAGQRRGSVAAGAGIIYPDVYLCECLDRH